jgi:serine/threonine protein kinase
MAIDMMTSDLRRIVDDCPGLSIAEPAQPLGRGNIKAVWRCKYDNEDYALKVMPATQLLMGRAKKELDLLMLCDSPYLPAVGPVGLRSLSWGADDAVLYFLEELIGGPSLDTVVKPLPLPQLSLLGLHIATALHELAAKGYLHRDIRQANIRQRDGKAEFVLLDVGYARDFAAATITRMGGQLDVHADMFSFGTILYECATGIHPFNSSSTMLRTSVKEPRSLNPALSDGLNQVILRLLDRPRHLRYGCVDELMEDLSRIAVQPS